MKNREESALLTDNPMEENLYDTTNSKLVIITDDNLKTILKENKKYLAKNNNYFAPLSLVVVLFITFYITDFNNFLAVEAFAWKRFYIFLTLGSVVWLILELRKIRKNNAVDALAEKILKKESTANSKTS